MGPDYGEAGWPLVVCEVVCKLEGQGLMLDDSVAEPVEESPNRIFNPHLLSIRWNYGSTYNNGST